MGDGEAVCRMGLGRGGGGHFSGEVRLWQGMDKVFDRSAGGMGILAADIFQRQILHTL